MALIKWRQWRLGWGTGVALLLLGGVLVYETNRAQAERTPTAPAPSRPARANVFAEGRLVSPAGSDITLAAEAGGRISALHAREFEVVEAGTLLVELESSEQKAALAEARARLGEIKVELAFLEKEKNRAVELQKRGTVAVVELDKANFNVDATLARSRTVSATIARLERALDKTRIVAPISGVVTAVQRDRGEVVASGDPLLTIVDLSRLDVEVEIGEFDIARVSLGAEATVRAEGFEGQAWSGRVEHIPGWVTSRRLKPLDPGKPMDTRVLPVKVTLPSQHPLKLGQRVEVEVQYTSTR